MPGFLCGMTNRGKDDLSFADTGFTASDTEHADRWHQILIRNRWRCKGDGKVGADGNKGSMRRCGRQPGDFPAGQERLRHRRRRDSVHGADLAESANGIDQACAGVRFDIVKMDPRERRRLQIFMVRSTSCGKPRRDQAKAMYCTSTQVSRHCVAISLGASRECGQPWISQRTRRISS